MGGEPPHNKITRMQDPKEVKSKAKHSTLNLVPGSEGSEGDLQLIQSVEELAENDSEGFHRCLNTSSSEAATQRIITSQQKQNLVSLVSCVWGPGQDKLLANRAVSSTPIETSPARNFLLSFSPGHTLSLKFQPNKHIIKSTLQLL